MSWTAHHQPPYIELVFEGQVDAHELMAAALGTLEQLLALPRPLVLADCTRVEGGHSAFDLYFLADMVAETPIRSTLREAIVFADLGAGAENVRFWETTCINRGLNVRVFTDRALAIRWLTESVATHDANVAIGAPPKV